MKTQDLKYKGGGTRLEIGDENVFREGVTVHCATDDGNATVIGSKNLFLIHAHVAHDCILGNHIIMSGFAGLAGHCIVEDYVILAGYVAVHQFCRIGKHSMIGGCCKVRQDVAPFMLADGDRGRAVVRQQNRAGTARHFRGVHQRVESRLTKSFFAKPCRWPTRWPRWKPNCRIRPK